MRKILKCAPYLQIAVFFALFISVSFTEMSVSASNEPNSSEAAAAVQPQITGEWSAEFGKKRLKKHDSDEPEEITKEDSLYLNLRRRSDEGINNSGSSYSISDFQGLTRDQVMGNSNVNFSLAREAGTFQFEGSFSAGKGSGRFTLAPSQSFLSAMNSRGYKLNEEKQFAAAMLDVRVKTVDDLVATGFKNLTIDDIFKATIFKITPEFVSEMNSIGFANLDMEDLVKARIFKIDAQFAREVASMGFQNQPMETLVKMRIFKVTPDFIREIRSAGLDNLDVEELVKLRIFKIDAAFIQRAKAAGSSDLDVEDLVRMKIHGKAE